MSVPGSTRFSPSPRQSYQTPLHGARRSAKPRGLGRFGPDRRISGELLPSGADIPAGKGGSVDEEREIGLLCDGTPDALRSGVTTCDARRSITALLVTALLLVGAVPAVRVACEVKHHPCAQSASIEACCGGEHTLLAASEPAGANSNPVASLSLVGPSSTDIEVSVLVIADDRLSNSSPPTDRSPDLVLLFRDLRL